MKEFKFVDCIKAKPIYPWKKDTIDAWSFSKNSFEKSQVKDVFDLNKVLNLNYMSFTNNEF